MRDIIRIVIFAAIVAGIALTVAPPVRTSASGGANHADRPAVAPSEASVR